MQRIGTPFQGAELEKLKAFLASDGLHYDETIQYTVTLLDDTGAIIGTGSLADHVIKCVLVRPDHQGEGLTGQIMTALTYEALRRGKRHLMLFTKPNNEMMFAPLGFSPVARTDHVLLMENQQGGIRSFVRQLERPEKPGTVGAVVCNCNPFTLGHRYLIEYAAGHCDWLYVFVLSEDRSAFPADVRLELVRRGTQDLPNVHVYPGGPYLITRATFPDYFLKEKQRTDVDEIQCALDLNIFYNHFALPLKIDTRFVGSEPTCPVTARYNQMLKNYLCPRGIRVEELPRVALDGSPVSASRVRELLTAGELASAEKLLPECTREFLNSPEGKRLLSSQRFSG